MKQPETNLGLFKLPRIGKLNQFGSYENLKLRTKNYLTNLLNRIKENIYYFVFYLRFSAAII